MSRGLISETEVPFVSPSPVRQNVPGMFLDDELYLSLCAAFDDLIAPDAVALDCLPAYLDPRLTPEDFLPWLGALVGAPANRAGIAAAVRSYGLRGTPLGLRMIAAAAAGVSLDAVRLTDAGGVRWSSTAGSAGPAPSAIAALRVAVAPGSDLVAVACAVELALEPSLPVHCTLRIEVVTP